MNSITPTVSFLIPSASAYCQLNVWRCERMYPIITYTGSIGSIIDGHHVSAKANIIINYYWCSWKVWDAATLCTLLHPATISDPANHLKQTGTIPEFSIYLCKVCNGGLAYLCLFDSWGTCKRAQNFILEGCDSGLLRYIPSRRITFPAFCKHIKMQRTKKLLDTLQLQHSMHDIPYTYMHKAACAMRFTASMHACMH